MITGDRLIYPRSRKEPYVNLTIDIIAGAVSVATGGTKATAAERMSAIAFLHGEKCHRWAMLLGVDWGAALEKLEIGE